MGRKRITNGVYRERVMIFRKENEWMGNRYQIYALRPFWLIKAVEWFGYNYVGPMLSAPIERDREEVIQEFKDFAFEDLFYMRDHGLKMIMRKGKKINHYRKGNSYKDK